jgi:hypothetical protein
MTIRRAPFFALFALAALPRVARAQELDTVITVASGTGLSLGQGADGVARKRSPIFLDVDVGLIFDGDRAMEWTPSLIMELEEKVSVGVNPSLKRVHRWRRFSFYGGLGFPFFFAPFTLLGVEVAAGATLHLLPRLGVTLELRSDLFFVGSDLPDGAVLAKMDAALGIRFDL